MSQVNEDLVPEYLYALRSDVSGVRDRLDSIETRLGAVEQTLGSLYTLSGSDRDAITTLTRRVERIERRLEIVD